MPLDVQLSTLLRYNQHYCMGLLQYILSNRVNLVQGQIKDLNREAA